MCPGGVSRALASPTRRAIDSIESFDGNCVTSRSHSPAGSLNVIDSPIAQNQTNELRTSIQPQTGPQPAQNAGYVVLLRSAGQSHTNRMANKADTLKNIHILCGRATGTTTTDERQLCAGYSIRARTAHAGLAFRVWPVASRTALLPAWHIFG